MFMIMLILFFSKEIFIYQLEILGFIEFLLFFFSFYFIYLLLYQKIFL